MWNVDLIGTSGCASTATMSCSTIAVSAGVSVMYCANGLSASTTVLPVTLEAVVAALASVVGEVSFAAASASSTIAAI